ncbi:MAG: glycan-binding surface protein [Mangrovibacterium sp.]
MQTTDSKRFKRALLFTAVSLTAFLPFFQACDDDDDDEKTSEIVLESFGPMPIARGAELRFIGYNLDQVTAVVIPDQIQITEFTSKTAELLTVTVPQEAVEGYVVLKTPQGDMTTKTRIGYSEPVSIGAFTPSTIKAGQELTITGDYLNLVKEIIFTDRISVGSTAFTAQSRQQIKVSVPAQACSGKIAVSNGAEDPVIVYSATELTVTLPAFAAVSPNPVKPGEKLTITGTDLDLVKTIVLGGEKEITSFVSQSAGKIELTVPNDTRDGKIKLLPASLVTVESAGDLVMVVPTVTVSPTTIKNGEDITVTGTDLDLIDKVIFGGDKEGTKVAGGTPSLLKVTVPDDAVSGIVRFTTQSTKTVNGPEITMIDPAFTSFSPAVTKANEDIAISGTDLDLVTEVMFTGNMKGIVSSQTATAMTVTVPVGAKTGTIMLITKNGSQIPSPGPITVNANLPDFTSFSQSKGTPGEILTINGANLSLIKQLIFPGNITATSYGTKTDAIVEVYVPMEITPGYGQIRMITYEGEEGLLPQIFFGGTDPVVDPALMITDCTNPDIPGNWGGNIEIASDPAKALSGNYIHGTAMALGGWAWIWGNNWWPFPSVTSAGHVLKMDVRVDKPLGASNVHFQMALGGTRIDIGAFGMTSPTQTTVGWVTVTYDLSAFGELPAVIPSNGDWGINFWYADGPVDISGLYIDNIRFEAK